MNTTSNEMKKEEITVFISSRDESICDECKDNLGQDALITLKKDKSAICLSCADLDHLVYLPAGDAALTRRSKAYSKLYAVVVEWSRRRKRYERQGLLVEEEALEKAEADCLADQDVRERRQIRAAERRAELDLEYVKEFAAQVRNHFPKCPENVENLIAEHACMKYSGRVGRSAAAKGFDKKAITLAVGAHVRHVETEYDELLGSGIDRDEARAVVKDKVSMVLDLWKGF